MVPGEAILASPTKSCVHCGAMSAMWVGHGPQCLYHALSQTYSGPILSVAQDSTKPSWLVWLMLFSPGLSILTYQPYQLFWNLIIYCLALLVNYFVCMSYLPFERIILLLLYCVMIVVLNYCSIVPW